MRALGWILALPLIVLAIVFAVANRHAVRLDLWPLPWGIDVPAYLAVLGALVAGLVIGICATWLSGHRARLSARANRHRVDSLTRQLGAERARNAAALSAPDQSSP